ncbi:unnamed protein product [Camellia sinensis]
MLVLPREEREKKSMETKEEDPSVTTATVDICPRQLTSKRALALLPSARVLTLPSPIVQEAACINILATLAKDLIENSVHGGNGGGRSHSITYKHGISSPAIKDD